MKSGRVALKPGKKQNMCSKKEEQSIEAMESVTKSGNQWDGLGESRARQEVSSALQGQPSFGTKL